METPVPLASTPVPGTPQGTITTIKQVDVPLATNTLLLIGFDYGDSDTVVTEMFYPFGNYKTRDMDKFILYVKSPSPYYYTDVFGTFILDSDDAWDAYQKIFTLQQVDDSKMSLEEFSQILRVPQSKIKDEFKKNYDLAYKKIMRY